MNYDVVHAEYIDGYRLRLTFADGASGEVDFFQFIERGGVFTVLRDVVEFRAFAIDPVWNTITWRNGELDIAPETLYHEATGNEPMMRVAEIPPKYGSSR